VLPCVAKPLEAEISVAHDREPNRAVVFIASDAVLAAWRERASWTDDIIGISDATELDLLTLIAHQQPQIVVLEESFACTERGAVLLGRLQTTPEFQDIDIRVLWSERVTEAGEQGTISLTTLATSIRPSYPAVRRIARRQALMVNVAIDGHRAVLIDLSVGGAQVLSGVALYRDQRVHLLLADSIPIDARVVWVRLETEPAPRYRAGVEFVAFDAEAIRKLIPSG
jgi:c-di-GMP-binding flagellar brake protein YcgR